MPHDDGDSRPSLETYTAGDGSLVIYDPRETPDAWLITQQPLLLVDYR